MFVIYWHMNLLGDCSSPVQFYGRCWKTTLIWVETTWCVWYSVLHVCVIAFVSNSAHWLILVKKIILFSAVMWQQYPNLWKVLEVAGTMFYRLDALLWHQSSEKCYFLTESHYNSLCCLALTLVKVDVCVCACVCVGGTAVKLARTVYLMQMCWDLVFLVLFDLGIYIIYIFHEMLSVWWWVFVHTSVSRVANWQCCSHVWGRRGG